MLQVGIERGSVLAIIDQTADLASINTTLAAVPGLAFEMEAGVEYTIQGYLTATAAAAGQDVDAGVSGVTDLTGYWFWETQDASNVRVPAPQRLATGAITASAVTDIADVNDVGFIWFQGTISSAAGGTFQITAAQGTDAGTTTVADSRMIASVKNQ